LKHKGYRTGVFLSADVRYGKLDEFLHDRGIDKLEDFRSRDCKDPLLMSNFFRYLNAATTDRCTATSMERWIDHAPGQPFFALMWTDQTHWPYKTPIEDTPTSRDRYLLGIREADAIIKDFVNFLDKRNLLASTLIVVVGDHGEGFGQH